MSALAPRARDDDRRAGAAQLGADRLAEPGRPRGLRLLPLGAGTEDDGVVGALAAGDVHRVHEVAAGQVLPDVGPAVHDGQVPVADQRLEDPGEHRAVRLIDRVHLQHDHVAVDEQAVEHVEHRDRRHVARTQHQGERPSGIGLAVEGCDRVPQRARGHPGLHPHVQLVAVEQQPVVGVGGEHPGDHLAVRAGPDPHTLQRVRAGLQSGQGSDHVGQPRGGRVRATEPLLAPDDRRLRVQALELHPGGHPRIGVVHQQIADLLQVPDLLPDRESGPAVLDLAEALEGAVDRDRVHAHPPVAGRTIVYRALHRIQSDKSPARPPGLPARVVDRPCQDPATMLANPAWMRCSSRSGSGMIPASVAMPMLTWPL